MAVEFLWSLDAEVYKKGSGMAIVDFICPTGDFGNDGRKSIELLRDQQKLSAFRKQAIAQAHEFDLVEDPTKYIQHYEKVIK